MKKNKSLLLLVNLGSPPKPSYGTIVVFLIKFLSDRRIITTWRFIAYPLSFIIALIRSWSLVKFYQKIWFKANNSITKSPLIYYSDQLTQNLLHRFKKNFPELIVKNCYNYIKPTIPQSLTQIFQLATKQNYNIDKIIVLPLYPQCSATTTLSVFDQVYKFFNHKNYLPNINFIANYYDRPPYLNAIANKIIRMRLNKRNHLLFSFHGIPEKLINQGDDYYRQCIISATKIAAVLGTVNYGISFQSRFGWSRWLAPSTSEYLLTLIARGIDAVEVVCPGFLVDCLETLEEIAVANKKIFLRHGGQTYNYINCLNNDKQTNEMFYQLLINHL